MSLTSLKKHWEVDCGDSLVGDLRTNIFTPDHFPPNKNAYSRMRVHLAVQVKSQSAIRIFRDNAEKCSGIAEVEPHIAVIEKVDRLIDIWNNTGMSNRKEFKGCEMIDSPNHFHLEELFEILDLFCEWKIEAGDNNKQYIPW